MVKKLDAPRRKFSSEIPKIRVLKSPLRIEFAWNKPTAKVVIGGFNIGKGIISTGRVVAVEQTTEMYGFVSWVEHAPRVRPGGTERADMCDLLAQAAQEVAKYLAAESAAKPPPPPKRPIGRPPNPNKTQPIKNPVGRPPGRGVPIEEWEFNEYKKEYPASTKWDYIKDRIDWLRRTERKRLF